MPRYSIQQRASMAGKKAQASAKKVPPAASTMAPEAKSRINALTTPAKEYTEHHGALRAISNVLQNGLNDVQEMGTTVPNNLRQLHNDLHQASLHLDAHYQHNSKQKHPQAAGHLKIAAENLANVASQLKKHAGPTVRDVDGSEFPLSFVASHAKEVASHYADKVAGVSLKGRVDRAQFSVKDTHKIGDIENRMGDLSGGAPLKHGTERFIPARPEPRISGKTHTLQSSRYKNAMPMYPAKIQGPDQKGA
jgi:hypothetical protein